MPTIWTKEDLSNTHWLNVQEALSQIATIEANAADFDFSPYAAMWIKTPEASESNCGGGLSLDAQNFFDSIRQLRLHDPFNALRIIAILERNRGCVRYPEKLEEHIHQILSDWLLNGQGLTTKQRINWALTCWKDWKRTYNGEHIYRPLITLLMQEADTDPEYVMLCIQEIMLANRSTSYSSIFNNFTEQIEACITFSRQVEHIQPMCLIDCLLRLLFEVRHDYRNETENLSETLQRDSANELYEIVCHRALSRDKQEEIYAYLILYAHPNQPWYTNLHSRLWEIENSKPLNERSWFNHQIISVNQPSDIQLVHAARASYSNLLNAYQSSPLSQEYIINHTQSILDQISAPLHAIYPRTRNRLLSQPSHTDLVEDCITIYWQMIEWLHKYHRRLYFYALETAIENATFHVEETNKIEETSRSLFLDEFSKFMEQEPSEGFYLFAYMIGRSCFSSIDKRICPILDKIYLILLEIDAPRTQRIIQSVHKNTLTGHAVLWHPNRLKYL